MLTTEAVLLTHCKCCSLMTKRMAVAGYTVDPRHEQKREKFGVANDLGSTTHPSNYACATVIVTHYLIFMKLKRTGLIRTAGRTML